jgi:hypothetical protein
LFDPATFITTPRNVPLGAGRDPSALQQFHDVAWSSFDPPSPSKARGAKLDGLRYERRVVDVLSAIYGLDFHPSPMIRYRVGTEWKRAILDGLLFLPQWTVIIEVKLAHTADVWEQLMGRYLPLVRILTGRPVRPVEVCRSYDPSTSLPGPHSLITSLHRPALPLGGLEVLKWRI